MAQAPDKAAPVASWRRVAVIGNGGSGKTTLARALSARLGLPLVHLDFHYWQGERALSAEDWREEHARLIAEDSWIIDGMKLSTLPARLERADAVIFLDLSPSACLLGLLRRRLRHRGRVLPELGVADRLNWEFVRYVASFRRRSRPRVEAAIAAAPATLERLVLSHRRDARRLIASLGEDEKETGRHEPARFSSLTSLTRRELLPPDR